MGNSWGVSCLASCPLALVLMQLEEQPTTQTASLGFRAPDNSIIASNTLTGTAARGVCGHGKLPLASRVPPLTIPTDRQYREGPISSAPVPDRRSSKF